uniref:Uncharacterized protein n=1 Tax=Caldiarchaeum subterraneum TaxID=311458 RepID=A0A7J3VU62_CALS0
MRSPRLFQEKKMTLAVLTKDFRLAAQVVEEAARRGLTARHVIEPAEIPLSARAVVMKRGEFGTVSRPPSLYAEDFTSTTSLVDRAVELAYSKKTVRNAVIAIDPGKTIGAAFMADELLLRTESYSDLHRFSQTVVEFFKTHPTSTHTILLGSGAPEFREEILRDIRSKTPDAVVKNVSEKNTSKLSRGIDELAAAMLPRMKRRPGK